MRLPLSLITLLGIALAYSSFLQAAAPPPVADNEYHFIVLGDSQFDDPATFNRLIDDSVRLSPAFVIQVGDMIAGYTSDLDQIRSEWQRFRRQVAPLKHIPFMPVPGNHDLYGASRNAEQAVAAIYTQTWGAMSYHFEYRNGLFVVLNTDGPEAEGRIDDGQTRELMQLLEANDLPHVFLFMHRPPTSLKNADGLHDLLKDYPVRYVFYGHHHHYHFRERDGIKYVMTNASANSGVESAHSGLDGANSGLDGANSGLDRDAVGGFDHLIQVAVRDGEVSTAVIKANSIVAENAVMPVDNYDLFALTRSLAPRQVVMRRSGDSFSADITLNNHSARVIRLEIQCSSADNRWSIAPARIQPISLNPGQMQTLSLMLSFKPDRPPESQPECDISVPFLTGHGQWLRHTHRVVIAPSDS